jgi:hypothetical protein
MPTTIPEKLGSPLPSSPTTSELTTVGFPLSRPYVLVPQHSQKGMVLPVGFLCSIPFSRLNVKNASSRSSEPTKQPTDPQDGNQDEESDAPVD